MEDLSDAMKERNYFAEALKTAATKKKTLQSQLDQASQEEAAAYQKLSEYEKQIKTMCKNLK